ncbi:mitochondrial enolase superfamily member 1-like isoform X2 [Tachypleus tridentatus]|uniref:mitochondrial enolase superfamily member 1-like isoform X2 n=1 Tax=Tachypleus tridentatus TaxID=6853 RepID=UPI003FD1164D
MSRTAEHVRGLSVRDIRFPPPVDEQHSTQHTTGSILPDYSYVYVELFTEIGLTGHGYTYTLGRGNEVVVSAVKILSPSIVGEKFEDIFANFGKFFQKLIQNRHLNSLGPEKGVVQMATSAVVNALWDLWARHELKPLWKLLVNMPAEKLLSTVDFTHISDIITREEALAILLQNEPYKKEREEALSMYGYPCYTARMGVPRMSEVQLRTVCREALNDGFTRFKVKIGEELEDDKRRLEIIREEIGWENILVMDASAGWDQNEAIHWMKELAGFCPLWVLEPTSSDDILAHMEIAEELQPLHVGVAVSCHNKIMFKQYIQKRTVSCCFLDPFRIGGVNEVLAICLMAAKFKVPVCIEARVPGAAELSQHLLFWEYVSLSGTLSKRMCAAVTHRHIHQHFQQPAVTKWASYFLPQNPGCNTEMKSESLLAYEFPIGQKWQRLVHSPRYRKSSRIPDWIENRCFPVTS